jgi:flagellin-like hook-associated protein FlgL
VFTSLDALRTALMNNDSKGISDAQATVGTSLTYLNGQLAYYGNVQNKVADATSFAASQKLQLQTHLSSLQDADLAESITELSQAQLQQTAALQVRAKMPTQTLFDFLG